MADTDLLFNILAVDNASAQFDTAAASIDRVTEAQNKNQSASHDLAGATDKVSESNKGLAESEDKASASGLNWASVLTGISSGIQIAQAALGTFKQAWDFAKEGAAIERVGAQFNQVAKDFGISGDEMVKAMDKAAHGTVDDEELMQVATRSMTQGVVTSQDQLVKFTEIARASAVRFGGDTAQALQSILYATEVGAQRQLKATLGVVDFTRSYEDLAKQLGKRKQDLTEEEMLQARVNAVLDKGAELVNKVGAAGEDNATKMQRFEAQTANLLDTVKTGAVDALAPFLNNLDLLQKMGDQSASTQEKMRAEIQFLIDRGYKPESAEVQILTDAIRKADEADVRFANSMNSLASPIRNATSEIAKQANEIVARVTDSSDLVNAITSEEAAMKRSADAFRDQTLTMSEARTLAISYTQDETKLGDLQSKLAALDEQIAAQGPQVVASIQNKKMSEQDRALTQAKLAAALEDAANVQRKAGESDAEYAVKVAEAKNKVSDLSATLGEHTAVLGGATKAQEEQRKALEDQIATFQHATEVQKATDVFNALTKAFQDGKLSADEYTARAEALNSVAHLYSDTALKAATNQELLVKSFTDPSVETWRGQLLKNEAALDGVADSAGGAAKKINDVSLSAADFVEKAKAPIKIAVNTDAAQAALKELHKGAAETSEIKTTAIADTADAEKTLTDYVSGPVDKAAQPITTKVNADTVEATNNVTNYTQKVNAVPADKQTVFEVVADAALNIYAQLLTAQNKLKDKTVTVTVIHNEKIGSGGASSSPLPGGAQHGADFIVPPNPQGGFGDYYPVIAGPGERVIVQTPAQQAAQGGAGNQTSIVNNETYNLYDTLTARQVAEQRRIDALKPLVSVM